MNKIFATSILSLLIISTFVSASDWSAIGQDVPGKLPSISDPATPANPSQPSQTQTSSGGKGRICKTLWVWDGKQYIKQDVVYRQTEHKGVIVDNVIRGSQCKVMNKKPTTHGVVGISDSLEPLQFEWYKASLVNSNKKI